MARRARVVIPGCPHHVTHRGRRGHWRAFLDQRLSAQEMDWIRQNLATGRPTGSTEFVKALEDQTGQPLSAQKRGPRAAGVVNIDLTEDMFG